MLTATITINNYELPTLEELRDTYTKSTEWTTCGRFAAYEPRIQEIYEAILSDVFHLPTSNKLAIDVEVKDEYGSAEDLYEYLEYDVFPRVPPHKVKNYNKYN